MCPEQQQDRANNKSIHVLESRDAKIPTAPTVLFKSDSGSPSGLSEKTNKL